VPGPDKGTGTGTDYDYEYRPGHLGRGPLIFREQALAEKYFDYKHKYQNFIQEEKQPAYTRDQYIGWAKKYAEQYGVPLSLVLHSMYRESGFYGNAEKMRVAKSPTGARGVMQIQPEWAEKGVYKIKIEDLLDPEKNIEAGVRGLAYYFNKYKDPQKALAAYNAGESGAKTYLRTGDPKTIRTAQTKDYIKDFKDDVIHQLEKFYPKNKQKVAQVATEILGTAVGAGNAQAADERPQTTTKVTKTDADPNRVRKGKMSIGNVVKDLATGKYTDYDTGKPVTDPAKIANFERLYRGEPEKPSTAASTAGQETFLDKVKRVAAGELTSKVFGGDKKPAAAAPTVTAAPNQAAGQDDFDSWLANQRQERLEREARLQADQELIDRLTGKSKKKDKKTDTKANTKVDKEKSAARPYATWEPDFPASEPPKKDTSKTQTTQSASGIIMPAPVKGAGLGLAGTDTGRDSKQQQTKSRLTVEPPDTDPETDPKAWAEYDKRMQQIQTAAGDKFSQERAARLEKERQAQASKTDKSSDVARLLQKDQSGLKQAKQAYKGSLASQRLQALNPEITDVNRIKVGQKINLPGQSEPYTVKKGDTLDKIASRAETSAMQSLSAADSRPSFISKDFGNAQRLVLDPGEKIVDMPAITDTNSDRFKAPIAEPELPAPSEIQQALKDFERELKNVDSDDSTTIDPRLNTPGQNIDWKTIAPELFDTDKDDKVSSADTLKESINTTSNAELHDILRLAGRI
jgi:hypothetical protein